jgi:hypothetical protein
MAIIVEIIELSLFILPESKILAILLSHHHIPVVHANLMERGFDIIEQGRSIYKIIEGGIKP